MSSQGAGIARLAACRGKSVQDIGAQLAQHPRFAQAVHILCREMLACTASDKRLDGMVKDAGFHFAALWALNLNSRDGLTLPELKAVCVKSGLLCAGRARALLIYLEHFHLIEIAAPARPNVAARYRALPELLDIWRVYLTAALAAVLVLEPAVGRVLARLNERGVLDAYIAHLAERHLAQALAADRSAAFVRVFAGARGGLQLIQIVLAAAPPGAPFPPRGAVHVSLSDAAKRLAVSRTHLRRMIDAAARAKLMQARSQGSFALQAGARAAIVSFFSMLLASHLLSAAEVGATLT